MSPSEEQLRRALSEGAGAGPDPGLVVVRAAAYRSQRRSKILSTIATVAVVAGAGTGIGVLAAQSGSDRSAKSSSLNNYNAGSGQDASVGAAVGGAGTVPPQSTLNATAPCPSKVPVVRTTADSQAQFFSTTVGSVTVCGYLGTGALIRSNGKPVAQNYSGKAATAIVTAVEAGRRQPDGLGCGAIPAFEPRTLLLVPAYASGTPGASVVVVLGCDEKLTNGATTRYGWTLPPELAGLIAAMRKAASAQTLPVGSSVVPAPTTS